MHRFLGRETSQVSPSGVPKGESAPAIESPPTRNNSRRDQPLNFVMAFTLWFNLCLWALTTGDVNWGHGVEPDQLDGSSKAIPCILVEFCP